MRTLQRYILLELLKALAISIAGYTAVLMLGGLVKPMREGLSVVLLLRLIPLALPRALSWTIPLASLTACVVAYGRLASDHEITAMRAVGIHPWQLLAPAALLAVALTIPATYLNDTLEPICRRARRLLPRRALAEDPSAILRTGPPTKRLGPIRLYFRGDAGAMRDVVATWPVGPDQRQWVRAPRGEVDRTADGEVRVNFYDGETGVQETPLDDGAPPLPTEFNWSQFEKYEVRVDTSNPILTRLRPSPAHMTTRELWHALRWREQVMEAGTLRLYFRLRAANRLTDVVCLEQKAPRPVLRVASWGRLAVDRKNGTAWLRLGPGHEAALQQDVPVEFKVVPEQRIRLGQGPVTLPSWVEEEVRRQVQTKIWAARDNRLPPRLRTEIHQRAAHSMAPLALMLVGVPLGVLTRRGKKLVGFGVSVGVIIGYYLLLAAGEFLGDQETLPAWAAAWLGNLTVAVVGLALLYRAHRR